MTQMVTSGSMSGERKRSDGLLGESSYERRCSFLAPPDLDATALLLDSTRRGVGLRRSGQRRVVVGPAARARPFPTRGLGAPRDNSPGNGRACVATTAHSRR